MKWFKEHRNLSLFIILIIALSLTYLFEEKRNKDREELKKRELSILDVDSLGDLDRFTGIKINVLKKETGYFSADNNLLLSNKKIEEFLRILSGLKIQKILRPEEYKDIPIDQFIPNKDLSLSFYFKAGFLRFTLGKKLDYDQSFYMEVERENERKLMIVRDDSPDPNVYTDNTEYRTSSFKYQRLQMLFYLTNIFFYETRVLKDFEYAETQINFKKIEIATFRNKKFLIDFEKTQTNPPKLNGLEYFEDNWLSFHNALINLEAKTIYFPYDSSKLDEILSVFNVEDRKGRKYTLELYKKYGSLGGYFLKTDFDKNLYELNMELAKYFFVNVQDFWQKKVVNFESNYSLKLIFPREKNREVELSISDQELFDAKSPSGKSVIVSNVKMLMDFLKRPADHVDSLEGVKEGADEKKILFNLQFKNSKLGVMLLDNEIVFIDLVNKVKFHFYQGGTIPFGTKIGDYIKNE